MKKILASLILAASLAFGPTAYGTADAQQTCYLSGDTVVCCGWTYYSTNLWFGSWSWTCWNV